MNRTESGWFLAILACFSFTAQGQMKDAYQLSGAEIRAAFDNVRDDAKVADKAGTTAVNYWYADGRFRNAWANGSASGKVVGRWYVQEDLRCVVIDSGLGSSDDKPRCGPIFRRGMTYFSMNPDGSTHGVHTLTPISSNSVP